MANRHRFLRKAIAGSALSLAAATAGVGLGIVPAHALISDGAADRIVRNCDAMGGDPELIFDVDGSLIGVRCVLPDGRAIVCIDDYAGACYWESTKPSSATDPRFGRGQYAGGSQVVKGVGTSPSGSQPTVATRAAYAS